MGAFTSPMEVERSQFCIMKFWLVNREVKLSYFLELQFHITFVNITAQWIHTSAHAPLPPNPIFVGNDADGSPIFVGRGFHNGEQLPCKVIPSKNIAYGEKKLFFLS